MRRAGNAEAPFIFLPTFLKLASEKQNFRQLACRLPELQGIDPETMTYYFRRVMVIATAKAAGMAIWRKAVFATMHLNANLPAAYFKVPTAQVVEVGLEVEI